jgi:hypothetical protein
MGGRRFFDADAVRDRDLVRLQMRFVRRCRNGLPLSCWAGLDWAGQGTEEGGSPCGPAFLATSLGVLNCCALNVANGLGQSDRWGSRSQAAALGYPESLRRMNLL